MTIKRALEQDKSFQRQKLAKTRSRRQRLDADRRGPGQITSSCRNDLLPDLKLFDVLLSSLHPSPHQVRRVTAAQIDRLVASIGDLGFNCADPGA